MKYQFLGNYLRSHRKKSGLSQRDVGILLGFSNNAQVSRHERFHRGPPLTVAFGYEAIYRVPVSDLFPEMHESINQSIEKRLATFESHLENKSGKGRGAYATAQKLIWLAERNGKFVALKGARDMD